MAQNEIDPFAELDLSDGPAPVTKTAPVIKPTQATTPAAKPAVNSKPVNQPAGYKPVFKTTDQIQAKQTKENTRPIATVKYVPSKLARNLSITSIIVSIISLLAAFILIIR